MFIARLIIDLLLAVLLLATGGGKLLQASSSLAIRDSLHLGGRTWRTIGVLEILAVIGLIIGIWVPAVGIAASAGVVLLMVGAITARGRAHQRQVSGYIADVIVLLIAVSALVLHATAL
jgi:hypothetical protein